MVPLLSVFLGFRLGFQAQRGSLLEGNGDFLGVISFQLGVLKGDPPGEWSLELPRGQEKGTP